MPLDKKPARSFSSITQTGLKAHALALAHRQDIEPRLAPGLIDGLAADLATLGTLVPAARQARAESKAATAGQGGALARAYALVSAIRTAVHRSGQPREVQRAYGVGLTVDPRVVKQVLAGADLIVARARKHPDEARAAGLLPADLDALEAAARAARGADAAQESARAAAPGTTQARNQAARRLIAATDRIAAAGVLAFAADPARRAEFDALIGAGNPERKKRVAEG